MNIRKLDQAVAFFTFNRLDTTKIVFETIREAKPSRLYLISDGPRKTHEDDKKKINDVRNYIEENIDWNCIVKKNYSEDNLGCKMRMYSGISWVLENEEQAIFIEDDIVPTQDFYYFCDELLEKYKDNEKIMSISGFKIVNNYQAENSYFFSNHPMIWGWATWRRAWKKYDVDIKEWPESKKNNKLKKYFNYFGYIKARGDFDSVYKHVKDTWDFQWQFTVLNNDGLTIVPSVNLINNIGFGRSDATHTTGQTDQDFTCYNLQFPLIHPDKIEADKKYDQEYLKKGWSIKALFKKVIRKIKEKILVL